MSWQPLSFKRVTLGVWWISGGEETQLSPCHQVLSHYAVTSINRSPHHPGRWVRSSRLIDEAAHSTDNLKPKLQGCVELLHVSNVNNLMPSCEKGSYIPFLELTAWPKWIHPLMGIILWFLHNKTIQIPMVYHLTAGVHKTWGHAGIVTFVRVNVHFLRIASDNLQSPNDCPTQLTVCWERQNVVFVL
jgi:hypothetical protein